MKISIKNLQRINCLLAQYIEIVNRKLSVDVKPIYATKDNIRCFIVAYRVATTSVYNGLHSQGVLLSVDNKYLYEECGKRSELLEIDSYLKSADYNEDFEQIKYFDNFFIKEASEKLIRFLNHPIYVSEENEIPKNDQVIFNRNASAFCKASMRNVLELKVEVEFLMKKILLDALEQSINQSENGGILQLAVDTENAYVSSELIGPLLKINII